MKGCFLEKVTDLTNSQIFKISRKVTLFYKESVLYPYVNFTEMKEGLILSNTECTNFSRSAVSSNFLGVSVFRRV